MKKLLIAILFAAAVHVAPPALACSADVQLTPARPAVHDDFTVRVSGTCPTACNVPVLPRIERQGSTIVVAYQSPQPGACVGGPAVPWNAELAIPRLPAGAYELALYIDTGLVKRVPFEVAPTPLLPAYGRAGTEVLIEREGIGAPCELLINPCNPPRVFFGNQEARSVRVLTTSQIAAIVPQLQDGIYDVRVELRNRDNVTLPRAFRYGYPMADESTFVLLPLTMEVNGANGSRWTTDNWIRNDAPIAVDAFNAGVVPPGGRLRVPNSPHFRNLIVYVPRALERYLTFSSHVRDTSRFADNNGTEIAVVSPRSLSTAPLRIASVPVDPRFRAALRVYALETKGGDADVATITMRADDGTTKVVTTRFQDVARCLLPEQWLCGPDPEAPFAVVDLSALAPAGAKTIDLEIAMPGRGWAFASVTNNQTQLVTTYSPQR